MKKLTIEINEKEIELVFNFKVIRLLGAAWGCDGPVSVMQKFGTACAALVNIIGNPEEVAEKAAGGLSVDVPFETVALFADVIRFSAVAADDTVVLDADDCAYFIFKNSETMGEIVKLFVESVPKPEPQAEKKKVPATAE